MPLSRECTTRSTSAPSQILILERSTKTAESATASNRGSPATGYVSRFPETKASISHLEKTDVELQKLPHKATWTRLTLVKFYKESIARDSFRSNQLLR